MQNEKEYAQKFKNQLDFCVEYLEVKLLSWLLEHPDQSQEYKTVCSFVDWVKKEAHNDMVVPRGKDGTSFNDRLK